VKGGEPTLTGGATRLKTLMDGLYYPAVLGVGFLAVIGRLSLHWRSVGDVTFLFAIVLVFYFSVSYLMTHELPDSS
jgi:hypothetical protein